jgi:hypothetical protein
VTADPRGGPVVEMQRNPVSVIKASAARFLRFIGTGAAGLTLAGLAAVELVRPSAEPCPLVSPDADLGRPGAPGRGRRATLK